MLFVSKNTAWTKVEQHLLSTKLYTNVKKLAVSTILYAKSKKTYL